MSAAHARYPGITPLIVAALPQPGGQPLSAREIHERVGFGSLGTTRVILNLLCADGAAIAAPVSVRRGDWMMLYRRSSPIAVHGDAA